MIHTSAVLSDPARTVSAAAASVPLASSPVQFFLAALTQASEARRDEAPDEDRQRPDPRREPREPPPADAPPPGAAGGCDPAAPRTQQRDALDRESSRHAVGGQPRSAEPRSALSDARAALEREARSSPPSAGPDSAETAPLDGDGESGGDPPPSAPRPAAQTAGPMRTSPAAPAPDAGRSSNVGGGPPDRPPDATPGNPRGMDAGGPRQAAGSVTPPTLPSGMASGTTPARDGESPPVRSDAVAPQPADKPQAADPPAGARESSAGAPPVPPRAAAGAQRAPLNAPARPATAGSVERSNDGAAEQLLRVLRSRMSDRQSQVTMRLDPPSLGAIRISMEVNGRDLALRIDSETHLAHHLLSEQADELRSALEAGGIRLERLELHPPADSNDPAGGWNEGPSDHGGSAGDPGGAPPHASGEPRSAGAASSGDGGTDTPEPLASIARGGARSLDIVA